MRINDIVDAIEGEGYGCVIYERDGKHIVSLYPLGRFNDENFINIEYDGTIDGFFNAIRDAEYDGAEFASEKIGEGDVDFDDMLSIIDTEEECEDAFYGMQEFIENLRKGGNQS